MLEPIVPLAEQLAAVRAVSRADGSVGRILDGHVNAQERLGTAAYDGLLGVWGANPGPGEGEPAWVEEGRLYGVKTYCSGAGGVERALVLVEGDLLHVEVGEEHTTVDESWYLSSACARPRRIASSHPLSNLLLPSFPPVLRPARVRVASRDLPRRAGARRDRPDPRPAVVLARRRAHDRHLGGDRGRRLRRRAPPAARPAGRRPPRPRHGPHADRAHDDRPVDAGGGALGGAHARLRDAPARRGGERLPHAARRGDPGRGLVAAGHRGPARPRQARPRRLPPPAPARPAGRPGGPGGAGGP